MIQRHLQCDTSQYSVFSNNYLLGSYNPASKPQRIMKSIVQRKL